MRTSKTFPEVAISTPNVNTLVLTPEQQKAKETLISEKYSMAHFRSGWKDLEIGGRA